MNSRQKLNLVLAVLAVGLVAGVLLSQKKDKKNPPLTALKAGAVTTIAIEHPDHPTITLKKTDGSWKLTAPVDADADALQVNSLLAVADTGVTSTLDPGKIKLRDVGLDPPEFTLKLNDTAIEFGGTEPLRFHRYVETGGKVALIEDVDGPAFDADYSDLVSKSVIPKGAEITRIEVPGLTVSRTDDGKAWQSDPATSDAVGLQSFVDQWKQANAMWMKMASDTGDETKSAPEPATITTKTGTIKLEILGRDPQLLLQRPDLKVNYALSKAEADKLLKLPPPPKPKAAAPAKDDSKKDEPKTGAAAPEAADKQH